MRKTKNLLLKYFRSADVNLDMTTKESKQEDQRIRELKANIELLHENTANMLSKTKQIEAHTEKIQSDSDALNEELIR